jgi:heterodisulfide reductase subunit D
MDSIGEIIKKTKAYYCLDCGKCTGNCPVSLFDEAYSPRVMTRSVVLGEGEKLGKTRLLWSCLSCKMCEERCPSDVQYIEFQKSIRAEYRHLGQREFCSHGGAFQSLMRIMTAPNLKQNRLGWLNKDLATSKKGEVLYFVGCLPYFDSYFEDLGICTLDTARGAIKIMNALGIKPILLENERCCGHDMLWTGDVDSFKRLAEHNIKEIQKSKAKKVVFSCPEGYRTFKLDYPRYFGDLQFEVVHLSELVADRSSQDPLPLGSLKGSVTYHDPCRLGRHMGLYDPPRELLKSIGNLELREMYHNKHTAVCCGTSAWMNCDLASKQIQMMRLREAKETGAQTLVTACPKCQIHLTCAMKDKHLGGSLDIEIRDLTTLVADSLPPAKTRAKAKRPKKQKER